MRRTLVILGAILAGAGILPLALRAWPGPPRRGVYGQAPEEWTEIFDLGATAPYHAFRLRESAADPAVLIREYADRKRRLIVSKEDFEPAAVPIVLRGESEWHPLTSSPRHILLSPAYETLLAAIERASIHVEERRSKVDLLARARFQNDLLLLQRSAAFFGSWKSFDLRPEGVDGHERSVRLERMLQQLIEKISFTEEEIAALPATGDLNVTRSLGPGWEGRYLYWRDLSTEHENATLETIQNETLVYFPKERAALFEPERVAGYIASGRWPTVDCLFLLLDQLLVVDRSGSIRKSPVTTLVRTARFFERLESVESRFGAFDVYLLERRATPADWTSRVVRLGPDAVGGALVDLPNIPGFLKPYYEVPLKITCIQCHDGSPRFVDPTEDRSEDEVARRFYVGSRPQRENR